MASIMRSTLLLVVMVCVALAPTYVTATVCPFDNLGGTSPTDDGSFLIEDLTTTVRGVWLNTQTRAPIVESRFSHAPILVVSLVLHDNEAHVEHSARPNHTLANLSHNMRLLSVSHDRKATNVRGVS